MNGRTRLLGVGLAALLGLALVAPATTFAATTAASPTTAAIATTTATCDDGHWPAVVQGMPSLFHLGARAGDYIWHDGLGWHLRVTHATTSRMVFTGRVSASAPIVARPVRLEAGDWIAYSGDRRTITYRFVNHGGVDGLNFVTACARSVTFGGAVDGVRLPVDRIFVGRTNAHPATNPFTVSRVI